MHYVSSADIIHGTLRTLRVENLKINENYKYTHTVISSEVRA